MKIELDFNDEIITGLVVESLKRDYEIADEDELKNAISVVLEYYMDPQQWADWNKEKVF